MEKKLAHLQMLQGVIERMAANSFQLKEWSVALISALFALSAVNTKVEFVYLAYFPACIFWILDGYYLWQERLFRGLYDEVRTQDEVDVDFSLDTSEVRGVKPWWRATFSSTLIRFHGSIVGVIVLVMCLIQRSTA